jgi:hypothetical protein
MFQNPNSENLSLKLNISDADLKKEIIAERKDINKSISELNSEIKQYSQSFKNDTNSSISLGSIISSANNLVSQISELIDLIQSALQNSTQTSTTTYYNNLLNQAEKDLQNISNAIDNIENTSSQSSNTQNNNQNTVVTQTQINNQTNTATEAEQDVEDIENGGDNDEDEPDNTQAGDDSILPNVSITSPAVNQYLSYVVTINASASDNVGVSKVEFYNGSQLIDTDTNIPYLAIWNTTSYQDGIYSLTAKAYDTSGNVKSSSAISVHIDNGAPGDQNQPGSTDPELIEGTNNIHDFL